MEVKQKIYTDLTVRRGEKEITMEKTIKKLRKEYGLTQEELGKKIGKSKAYIAELESGKRDIKGVAAQTLVKLAEELGTQAEYIINPPEYLDDKDFEWDKVYDDGNDSDYWLVVDGLAYSKQINQHIFYIDGCWYQKIDRNAFTKSKPIDEQMIMLKNASWMQPEETPRDVYYAHKCTPRGGINIPLGREITKTELDEITKQYGLSEVDISNEFVDKRGDIYGKYRKVFTSIQIRIAPKEALDLESKLNKQGIEAANVASGCVNIRIK